MWISAGALILALLLLLGLLVSAARRRASSARSGAVPGGRRWPARLGAVLCLTLSAFFTYAWYAFYLKWDFNELGRYYDPDDQVVYTSSGFVWVVPATLLLAAGLLCVWRGWRRR